jgi:hypothetical protein
LRWLHTAASRGGAWYTRFHIHPTFARLMPSWHASGKRVALWGVPEQHQEVAVPPELVVEVSRTCITGPIPPTKRGVGRTYPVRLHSDRLRFQPQHRATCLGLRSAIRSSMRRNRSRGTATSAIWKTV